MGRQHGVLEAISDIVPQDVGDAKVTAFVRELGPRSVDLIPTLLADGKQFASTQG
jgi:hypothetical protein